jgi:enoyl-CoA hydratase/carnithine racemase
MTVQPPRHFRWEVTGKVATITLDRPERKNPLTFESYAELRDAFRALALDPRIKAVVITGAAGNFCSGGDVFEIIEPLTRMKMPELLAFTPIIAAVEGVCAGAGAILAMAADLRYGTADSRTAFLFTRVGLAGCDMGACAILPRIIGQGRAGELLYSGRSMTGEEGERWGFFNALHPPGQVLAAAQSMAAQLADGPTFAHGITKTMLHREWSMDIESAIEAEAQAQAICMATEDFHRAFEAFAAKRRPEFKGD